VTGRRAVIVGVAAAAAAAVAVSGLASGSGTGKERVLLLRHAVRAGGTIDPGNLFLGSYPARLTPPGALTSTAQAAFRTAAVTLPAGLPLISSFVRDRLAVAPLRRTERALGIRVDDVTGLPQLLGPGTRADVLVAGTLRVQDAEVMTRPRRNGDGVSWSVALRLPAALAAEVARAESRGLEIRLLPRDVRP
jgi:Flp pilus assembly protein CpaB